MLLRSRAVHAQIAMVASAWLITAYLLAPGWLFFDSATQWTWVANVWTGSGAGMTGNWPLVMTAIKVPFAASSIGLWLFGGLQAAAVFVAVATLAAAASTQRRNALFATLIVTLSPYVWNYAWLHSSDALSLAALLVALAVMIHGPGRHRLVLLLATILVLSAVRRDGVIVATALAIAGWIRWRQGSVLRANGVPLALCLAIAIGAPPIGELIASKALNIPTVRGTEMAGLASLAWQTGALDLVARQDGAPVEVAELAAQPVPGQCVDEGMWCHQNQDLILPYASASGGSRRMLRGILERLLDRPSDVLAGYGRQVSRAAGLSYPLYDGEIGRWDAPLALDYRQVPSEARLDALAALRAADGFGFGVLRRPWVWLLVLCILATLGPMRFVARALLFGWLAYLVTVGGIGPFADLRYQLPFLIAAALLTASAIVETVTGPVRTRSGTSPV